LLREGRQLSAIRVEAIERRIDPHKDQIADRIRLLGYYSPNTPNSVEPRRIHLRWLIQNHPELPGLGEQRPTGNTALFEHDLWLKQVSDHPDNLAILDNAQVFFQSWDDEGSIRLLRQAEALEPGNVQWVIKLGFAYLLRSQRYELAGANDETIRMEMALQAVQELERANAMSERTADKESIYRLLAEAALRARMIEKAEHYATLAATGRGDDSRYVGNLLLGQIALSRGEIEGAKRYLLESTHIQRVSILPRFQVALRLLERGGRETVLTYLQRVNALWPGRNDIERWLVLIQNGVIPTDIALYR